MNTSSKIMSDEEAEDFVIRLLMSAGPMTTREIELAASLEKRRCPDRTVLFLAKMRGKGLIEGEVSVDKKGWLWRAPQSAYTPPS